MKNLRILILTAEYPNPNSTFDTPVVHYYAKEWVKLGFDVRVMHYRSVFPRVFYFFANHCKQLLKRVFKTDFIPFERLNSSIQYELDGVKVVSRPIFKVFPHLKYWNATIKKHAQKICSENRTQEFTPDVILGHFLNPQLPLLYELKKFYPETITSLVLHENPTVIAGLFGSKAHLYLKSLDHIGFRFEEMKNIFIERFGRPANLFICPSGIPESYILPSIPAHKFKTEKISFCFVGMLIPLKNVDILLESLDLAFPDRNFNLKLVGTGMLRESIDKKIAELNLGECVSMEGKMSRDEVQRVISGADVFVMVSKPEAFGLVYVEAMGKGCLTIGTIGQGIDGIIRHGENGFLCEARNVSSLRDLLKDISAMTYEQKMSVASKGLDTASGLTDQKVALSYLRVIKAIND